MANNTNEEIILIGRKNHVDTINKNGLLITGVNGTFKIKNIQALTNLDNVKDIDIIFITTKAYDTKKAALCIKNFLNEQTIIVSLQNGLGTEIVIKENIEITEKIFRATTSNGALMKEPGHVIHTGFGNTIVGCIYNKYQYELKKITKLFSDAGFKPETTNEIKNVIWKKIMVNVGINPLGTLLNVTNGLIPQKIPEKMIKKILNEAIEVAKKENVSINLKDAYDSVIDVCHKTKNNRNSMLQDIDNGKKTEIDFINGAIVFLAKKYDIEVPYNELITALIKGIEKTS